MPAENSCKCPLKSEQHFEKSPKMFGTQLTDSDVIYKETLWMKVITHM